MAKKDESFSMKVRQMTKHIKNDELKNIYLFYGEEAYLKDTYTRLICTRLKTDSNSVTVFDGDFTVDQVEESVSAVSMFSDTTVVVVKNSGYFKKSGVSLSFLEDIDTDTYIIFKENEADARNANFKFVENLGMAFNCEHMTQSEIAEILGLAAGRHKRGISGAAVELLISGVGDNVWQLINEVEKLCLLVGEGETIEPSHVKNVTALSLNTKSYVLADKILQRNKAEALVQLKALLDDREPAQVLLVTVARRLLNAYQAMLLQGKGMSNKEIGEKIKMKEFAVQMMLKSAVKFNAKMLEQAIDFVSDVDYRIKNGLLDPVTGLELMIQELCS